MHSDKQILFKRINILFLPCTLLVALAAFFYLFVLKTWEVCFVVDLPAFNV